MKVEELITYVDNSMKSSGLKLSELAKTEIMKRFKNPEDQGGYSEYWKTISLEEANSKRKLRVVSYSGEGKDREIVWVYNVK
jgi:hypothetical protein